MKTMLIAAAAGLSLAASTPARVTFLDRGMWRFPHAPITEKRHWYMLQNQLAGCGEK